MVKSPFNLIITHLIKPQVANQQQQKKRTSKKARYLGHFLAVCSDNVLFEPKFNFFDFFRMHGQTGNGCGLVTIDPQLNVVTQFKAIVVLRKAETVGGVIPIFSGLFIWSAGLRLKLSTFS